MSTIHVVIIHVNNTCGNNTCQQTGKTRIMMLFQLLLLSLPIVVIVYLILLAVVIIINSKIEKCM